MSKKMKMTNAGNTLRLEALGGTPIQFTRLVLGDGQLTTQEPASLTEVIHEVHSIQLDPGRCRVVDDHFEFGVQFDRSKITTAFRWRELALYATDPASGGEIAYAYGNDYDEGEYITPDTSGTYVEEEIHISAYVGAATVNCAYDESVVWVTVKQLEDRLAEQEAKNASALHSTLNAGLSHKAGRISIGPASMVNSLEPGGLLLVTDDQDPATVAVTLDQLISEAHKINTGVKSGLDGILTAEIMLALNLRADADGGYFTAQSDLRTLFLGLAALAVEMGYVDSAGTPELSWSQTQKYLISGILLSAEDAGGITWPWEMAISVDALTLQTAALRSTVDELQRAVDDATDDINVAVHGEAEQ